MSTKQQRKTARRKNRQARAYALFQRDYRERLGYGEKFPPWYGIPDVLKQQIVEKYG